MNPLIILAIGPYWPAGSFRYLTEAFEHVGVTVYRVGPIFPRHGDIHWPEENFPRIDLKLNPSSRWEIPFYVDLCTAQVGAPNLILYHEETYNNEIVPKLDIPSVLWSFDGWNHNFDRIETFQATKGFINHPLGIRAQPRLEEDPRWEFMPGAAAPWVHKDLCLTRDIDFVLLASMYGYRWQLCYALTKTGYTVAGGFRRTEDFVEIHNRGLLTYHNCNGQEEIKVRFFEAAAMGICVTSDHTFLFDRLGYKPWKHYIPCPIDVQSKSDDPNWHEIWPSQETIVMVMQWVKKHPRDARQIAYNCQQLVLAQDTYYHRARRMVQSIGLCSDMLDDAFQAKIYNGLLKIFSDSIASND